MIRKQIKRQKEKSWKKIISREYGVQYAEISLRSLSPRNKFIVPKPFYEQIYIPEDRNETCYVDEKKWSVFVNALKKKYLGNIENYEKFEKLFMKTGNEYVEIAKQIANKNLEKKSSNELKKLYLTYQKKSLRYAPFIWIQFIINNFFADKVKEILVKKLGERNKKLYNFYEIALKPDKKASSVQLTEIAQKWRKMNLREKVQVYKDFKWIPCLDIHNKPWTKKEFFSHISDFQKREKESLISYEFLIKQINPSTKERQIFDIAKRLAYLKDLKDDFRRQGIFYGRNLFKEITRRMKVKLEDMSYILESEIVTFLNNKSIVPQKIIKERKNGFVVFFTQNKKVVCKSGSDINPVLSKLGLKTSKELSEWIKGIPASSGRARGVVTIVKGVSELAKMKKGNVLVAVTTHPDYVPAMQKAVAIVTDEGGLTSHAAITSRELDIPCIVGTKIATKVLKDGYLAEVNAKKGVVKVLKK